MTFKCRDSHKTMYGCIEKYQTLENLDLEREKIIAEKRKRQLN